jgi:hypothetical protein
MILRKLEEHWAAIEKIGAEAEERGRPLGLQPSCAAEPDKATIDRVRNAIEMRNQFRNLLHFRKLI